MALRKDAAEEICQALGWHILDVSSDYYPKPKWGIFSETGQAIAYDDFAAENAVMQALEERNFLALYPTDKCPGIIVTLLNQGGAFDDDL